MRTDGDAQRRADTEARLFADPKPARRVKDTSAGMAKVQAEGRCRGCGATSGLNRAHVLAKGQRGDDVAENVMPLCGSGSTGCHGILTSRNPGRCGDGEWRTFDEVAGRVRASFVADELAYLRGKLGDEGWQDWLDRAYPARKQAA